MAIAQLAFDPMPAREGRPEGLAVTDRKAARRLRALVDAHWEFVGRLLRHLGVTEVDLDDAVQQVFLVASDKLDDIRAGSERAFLAKTGVNIAARVRRSRGRAREVAVEVDAADPAPTPDEQLDRERALAWLHEILEGMELDLRSVFVLYEVEEMTMAEIAVAMEIPPGTVASRLRRAREEFRARAHERRTPRAAGGEP
jgi:RNA polymerase sigma-70 factor (ECF subfamily)